MKNVLMLLAFTSVFVSCGDNEKNYNDYLKKENEISSQEEIRSQRVEQERKASELEVYLNKRKTFIEVVEGSFSGELEVESMNFAINLEMIPSMPIEYHTRARQIDEITYEIENLSLNIKVKMENPLVPNSASSCNIVGHKPDLKKGIINILTNECKNVFKFLLTDVNSELDVQAAERVASELSSQVTSGAINYIEYLDGVFESSVSSKKYQFKLERIK